ncbi:MAG: EF-P lysine aminoacylase EpmA [Kiritimatiellia bacterium]
MTDIAKLEVRARVLRQIRAFFDARGFVEVETPVRIPAPAPEPHIDCPASGDWFLRASPELQMKKLLAVGMTRIWQMGPCFRAGERGSRHSPEFTMLEWYRAQADYLDILADMESLVTAVLGIDSTQTGFRRVTVRAAYREYAGWDPFADWDADRFDFDMATKIEPNLPKEPTFLIDYPPQAASLSKLRGDVAERWELYVGGMELANAFTELTDADEQRRRFESARAARREIGEADYPLDEDFLRLLQFMPPSGGVALGVDRLVMLAADAKSIDEVRVAP